MCDRPSHDLERNVNPGGGSFNRVASVNQGHLVAVLSSTPRHFTLDNYRGELTILLNCMNE